MSKKNLIGTVVSDKMEKTVVVEVERDFHHPRYQKKLTRGKGYKVANLLGAKVGDRVRIEECRPLSKGKRFQVVEILAE